jgi:hypothetical protein
MTLAPYITPRRTICISRLTGSILPTRNITGPARIESFGSHPPGSRPKALCDSALHSEQLPELNVRAVLHLGSSFPATEGRGYGVKAVRAVLHFGSSFPATEDGATGLREGRGYGLRRFGQFCILGVSFPATEGRGYGVKAVRAVLHLMSSFPHGGIASGSRSARQSRRAGPRSGAPPPS